MKEILCPRCKAQIPPGDFCPVCQQQLVQWSEWIHIYTVSTEWEAELLKGLLESHEIPVVILSQRDSSRQFTVGHLALVRIFVPISHAIPAFQLLQDYETGSSSHPSPPEE